MAKQNWDKTMKSMEYNGIMRDGAILKPTYSRRIFPRGKWQLYKVDSMRFSPRDEGGIVRQWNWYKDVYDTDRYGHGMKKFGTVTRSRGVIEYHYIIYADNAEFRQFLILGCWRDFDKIIKGMNDFVGIEKQVNS